MNALQLSSGLFAATLLLAAAWFWLPRWYGGAPRSASTGSTSRQDIRSAALWVLGSSMVLALLLLSRALSDWPLVAACVAWLLGLTGALCWRSSRVQQIPAVDSAVQSQLQQLLDALPQALAEVAPNRRLIRINQAFLSLLQIEPATLPTGAPVARLMQLLAERSAALGEIDFEADAAVEVDADHVAAQFGADWLQPLVKHSSRARDGYVRIAQSEGRWLGLRLQSLPSGGWLVLVADLTEQHRVEHSLQEIDSATRREVDRRTRELRTARREAEQANVSRTRFLTAASHDLLQPMNAARLLAGSLADHVSADSETKATAQRIEEAIVAAESILDSLLESGRLDAKAVKPRIGVVTLARLFEGLSGQFAPVAARRKLKLRLRPTRLQVHSDQLLLQRLLSNLLSNALRYTSKGGVLVAARRRGEQVLIQVFDTGIGIDSVQKQLIFHEFRTGRQESPWGERGLGLGLALCSRTASLLQHPFGVESIAGQGSCFHLKVPLAGMLSSAGKPLVEQPASSPLKHLRVLCIDDDQDSLNALAELLRRWGVQVRIADGYSRARELTVEFEPHVLLVDYLLDTELDGFDVIGELRRLRQLDLPAAVVSATRSDYLRDEAATQHCELFLKPVKPTLLRAWLSLLPIQEPSLRSVHG